MTNAENSSEFGTFKLDSIRPSADRMESNTKVRPRGWDSDWDECLVCHRPVNADKEGTIWVHMSTYNYLYLTALPEAETEENSQGWFPVGPECARKIPADYKSAGLN